MKASKNLCFDFWSTVLVKNVVCTTWTHFVIAFASKVQADKSHSPNFLKLHLQYSVSLRPFALHLPRDDL